MLLISSFNYGLIMTHLSPFGQPASKLSVRLAAKGLQLSEASRERIAYNPFAADLTESLLTGYPLDCLPHSNHHHLQFEELLPAHRQQALSFSLVHLDLVPHQLRQKEFSLPPVQCGYGTDVF